VLEALETSPIDADLIVDCIIDLNRCTVETLDQIDRDLPRTYPDVEFFANTDIREGLGRVLRAIAIEYPDVGYVQGMNFLLANILLHTNRSESDAFYLFRMMMESPKYGLHHIFVHGLPNLRTFSDILDWLIMTRHPDLHQHFEEIGFEPLFYSQNWIMTLFSYMVPFVELAAIWDNFFEYGWESIFQYSLALFELHHNTLLISDFENCAVTLRKAAEEPSSSIEAVLLDIVFSDVESDLIRKAVMREPFKLPRVYPRESFKNVDNRRLSGISTASTVCTEVSMISPPMFPFRKLLSPSSTPLYLPAVHLAYGG